MPAADLQFVTVWEKLHTHMTKAKGHLHSMGSVSTQRMNDKAGILLDIMVHFWQQKEWVMALPKRMYCSLPRSQHLITHCESKSCYFHQISYKLMGICFDGNTRLTYLEKPNYPSFRINRVLSCWAFIAYCIYKGDGPGASQPMDDYKRAAVFLSLRIHSTTTHRNRYPYVPYSSQHFAWTGYSQTATPYSPEQKEDPDR